MIKHLDHFVIFTKDVQKCVEFYEKLGFKIEQYDDRYYLKAHTFGINIHEADKVASYATHAEHPQIGSIFVSLEVEGTNPEVMGFLENVGIPVLRGPLCKRGFYGRGVSVYIKDPDGNVIELITYEEECVEEGD